MNNSQPNSLSAIVDAQTFIDNPLDIYENYTYNLELFVVDRIADRKFQIQEGHMIKDIVNNNWPGPADNSITIAKTGVTTEFNITDLEVQSNSVGNSTNSKIAGTATTLSITITQVGETSLADNVHNAFALCGFETMSGNNFYIKINFLGYNGDGLPISIPNSTKVIPFNNTSWKDMQTQTDSRGTTTTITGSIPQDRTVSKDALSVTETGFTYKIGKTLKDTLDNFIEELNNSNTVNHPTLSKVLQNTYKYSFSDNFKKKYLMSNMQDNAFNFTGTQNMVQTGPPGGAEFVGTVTPMMSIYTVLEEICLNSSNMKKELIKANFGTSDTLKISPYMVIKEGGYNPVKSTNVYEVEYFIDYEQAIIVQNPANAAEQALNSKKITEGYFKANRVNKLYNYLFTGKNDQILDFNISLDRQLAKTYSPPTDAYRLEHFMRPTTAEGEYLSKQSRAYITAIESDIKKLTAISDATETRSVESLQVFKKGTDSIRTKIMAQIKASSGMPPNLRNDIFAGKTEAEFTSMMENNEYKDLFTPEMKENRASWLKAIDNAKREHTNSSRRTNAALVRKGIYLDDAHASVLQASMFSSSASNETFSKLNLGPRRTGNHQRKIVLVEELDNDVLTKMSNEDFGVIMRSHALNPTEFKPLVSTLEGANKTNSMKSTDVENIDLVREKYYESKNNQDASMINATMSIKGDPFWIEGYMSPANAKTRFADAGALLVENEITPINGPNAVVIVSGASDGVDLHDNVLIRNLITHLYTVTDVVSTFSGGRFIQTLKMVRIIGAEEMIDSLIKEGQKIDEVPAEIVADTLRLIPGNIITNGKKGYFPPGYIGPTTTLENGVYVTRNSAGDIITSNAANASGTIVEGDGHGDGDGDGDSVAVVRVHPRVEAMKQKQFEDRMATVMASYQPRNAVSVAPANTLVEHTAEYVEEFEENTDLAVSLQEAAVDTAVPESPTGAALRKTNAAMYLNDLPMLTRICRSEKKRGQLPFASCDAIKAHDDKVLEIFETTPGVTPTITEINAYLNNNSVDTHPQDGGPVTTSSSDTVDYNVITDIDDGTGTIVRDRGEITTTAAINTEYSDLEIAQFQIAAGGVLTVDGHDPADIEKIVRKASLAKTPEIILENQANGIDSSELSNEKHLGAVVDNKILDTTIPLVVEATKEVVINAPITPPKTEEEFKLDYDAIRADTSCVGDCRARKLMLLSVEMNDTTKEQYYLDKKVETIINEAKVASQIDIKTRKLIIPGFTANTHTQMEHEDRVVLTNGINAILENNTLTSDEVVKKESLIRSAVDVLDADIKDNDLIISDTDRAETVIQIVEKVSTEATLNAVSDKEYDTITSYAGAIELINDRAKTGHRADLTGAVLTAGSLKEVLALRAEHDEITAIPYYFDPIRREADKKAQAKLEDELALLVLAQPDETISQIATIETAGITRYIPIKTPVILPIAVEQEPILVKSVGLPVNTYDIITPGSGKDHLSDLNLIVTDNKLHQYGEANKIYKILLSEDYGSMTTVTDDAGVEIVVKDYSILPAMTYINADGDLIDIPDPSTYFGLRTVTYDDMNPSYAKDYNVLKEKIATLFPNVSTIDPNAHNDGNSYTEAGALKITISGNKFYIEQ